MHKKLIIFIIALGLVGGLTFLALQKSYTQAPPANDLTAFAQCLKDKGVTMYGAAWCGHCQNQKKLFGQAWKLVPYVECPDNIQKCLDLGIKGYPTWILPDGTHLEGGQSLETLAEKTGCALLSNP